MASIVQNALFARRDAMQGLDEFRQGRAQVQAGSALAGGDPTTAANVLNRTGMLDQAQAVTTNAKAQADDTTTRAALGKYVAKDYGGAATDFAAAGSLKGVDAAQSAKAAADKDHLEFTLRATHALRGIAQAQGPDHAVAAFDQLTPTFKQMGADDSQLAAYRQALAANPQQFLDAVDAATRKEMEAFTLKPGEKRFGPDGKEVASIASDPKYMAVPEGGMLVPLPTGQGAPSAAPQPSSPAARPGGVQGAIYGPPKTPKEPKVFARPATASEKAAYGISPDVPAQMKPDGSIDVISGTGANLKPVPPQIQKGLIGNRASIKQIDEAIALLKANPKAMGLKNKLGDDITQRLDPQGVPVRGAVANIGSLVLHDRSGAAVTASEQPRLMPFIPMPSDTAQTAIQKLRGLKHQYENANDETELAYGSDSGYRPMGGEQQKAAPSAGGVIRYDAQGNRVK